MKRATNVAIKKYTHEIVLILSSHFKYVWVLISSKFNTRKRFFLTNTAEPCNIGLHFLSASGPLCWMNVALKYSARRLRLSRIKGRRFWQQSRKRNTISWPFLINYESVSKTCISYWKQLIRNFLFAWKLIVAQPIVFSPTQNPLR